MKTYYINDSAFTKTDIYKKFIKDNPSKGFLKIRAYAASQAIPIEGLKIIVTKNIENNNIVFFEGSTNESGIIENIELPAPTLGTDDENIPNNINYNITAIYVPNNTNTMYKINVYENVYVVQNINVVPNMNLGNGN